jgi:hypothetical protein
VGGGKGVNPHRVRVTGFINIRSLQILWKKKGGGVSFSMSFFLSLWHVSKYSVVGSSSHIEHKFFFFL